MSGPIAFLGSLAVALLVLTIRAAMQAWQRDDARRKEQRVLIALLRVEMGLRERCVLADADPESEEGKKKYFEAFAQAKRAHSSISPQIVEELNGNLRRIYDRAGRAVWELPPEVCEKVVHHYDQSLSASRLEATKGAMLDNLQHSAREASQALDEEASRLRTPLCVCSWGWAWLKGGKWI